MASNGKKAHIFELKYFSLVIAFIVFLVIVFLNYGTIILSEFDLKVLDGYFQSGHLQYKMDLKRRQERQQEIESEGVDLKKEEELRTSSDILIAPIDFDSLQRLGRWPFPRSVEANYVNFLTRIVNQDARERALLLDIFFVEKDSNRPENDIMLIQAIKENKRVFLETVVDWFLLQDDPLRETFYEAQATLEENCGTITNIQGDWEALEPFFGVEPPLKPYAQAAYGFGHANYDKDNDQIYRRNRVFARYSRLIAEYPIPVHEITEGLRNLSVNKDNFEWLGWLNRKNGEFENISFPFSEENLAKLEKEMQEKALTKPDQGSGNDLYIIRKFKDSFVPSISLALALEYMNKKIEDVEVKLGEYVRISEPEFFNIETNAWEKPYRVMTGTDEYYTLDEIKIPIDKHGDMLINFMGPGSTKDDYTFKLRPFYYYAQFAPGPDPETSIIPWPKAPGGIGFKNKLVLAGGFFQGTDEKPTPFGLMYGVEVHANSLDTIIRNNFLFHAPVWLDLLIILGVILLIAFISSRLPTLLSLHISIFIVILYMILICDQIFQNFNFILSFTAPPLAIILTVLMIVAYRVIFEERDKRRIRGMFGKYVSPAVVDQILQNPPELGGVDKELTVLFSDIRGFTTLSESMTPQALVEHLNHYLTAMTDLILEYRGTLDKYVGDEIMCFWGAPLPQAEHAIMSCKCALKQMEVLHQLNEKWPPEKRINIGIGLNSGIMTVGNMGSQGRMNYTLMGDNVNLGARLEGTNKTYHTNIIISEFTYGLVKDKVIVRELDNIRVKGKNKPVVIYELLDVIGGLSPE
ncbi:MAG: adenylate/guanylate cyclase domain-containing protein [Spirochaetales bacterium]|nr:adenylate/guanylate cyclase domain-containing protein [Spirochaetales bacterium]